MLSVDHALNTFMRRKTHIPIINELSLYINDIYWRETMNGKAIDNNHSLVLV